MKKYRITNKKKFFSFCLTVVAVIISSILLFTQFGEKYKPELVSKKATVSYERLNVRARPGLNSEIIDELYYGDTVYLTGKRYEYWDGPHQVWVETQYGWVTVNGLSFTE